MINIKKMTAILFILSQSQISSANVDVLSKDSSVQKLPESFWKKQNANYVKQPTEKKILSPIQRDQILNEVGLLEYFESKDHLEKDLFIIRVRKKSIAEIRQQYPELSEKALTLLKKKLQ